jgi:3-deoxy-D-manno-octulosonic-acid transferase
MNLLYNIGIRLYISLIFIASLFKPKAKLWIEGRKNVFNNLQNKFSPEDKVVWMHCASLGEFEQGRPVIEAFKKQFPSFKILITFFSPSGFEIRKNYPGADFICYLPADTTANARKFIEAVKPTVAFFVKYEFWYNYINELEKIKTPLFLVSAIFREGQIFFKPYGNFQRNVLKKVTHFFVQDEASQKLLSSIGINQCTITGDTRFDRVNETVAQSASFPEIENFCKGSPVLVAGSTWEEDEKIIAEVFKKQSDWKIIIAPHEVNESHISKIENIFKGMAICRFSKLHIQPDIDFKILIIDSIGHLSKIYKYGSIAYIGGGFGKGIHNILEAAAFGLPVILGSNYQKFKEAKDLIKVGGAFSINSAEEFSKAFISLNNIKLQLQKASEVCKNYVMENKGATGKILSHLKQILP